MNLAEVAYTECVLESVGLSFIVESNHRSGSETSRLRGLRHCVNMTPVLSHS